MTKIGLQNIVEYEDKSRKLQAKLLMMFDDEISALPAKGIERLMCTSRYAAVFGRLWQFFTKQGLVMKESVQNMGGEVEIGEDVPIEKLQEMISIPIAPKTDRGLNARPVPNVMIEPMQALGQRGPDIGTQPVRITDTAMEEEPEDESPDDNNFDGDADDKDDDQG
jgi:hypothetical protein